VTHTYVKEILAVGAQCRWEHPACSEINGIFHHMNRSCLTSATQRLQQEVTIIQNITKPYILIDLLALGKDSSLN
jgi:hypothetical protein